MSFLLVLSLVASLASCADTDKKHSSLRQIIEPEKRVPISRKDAFFGLHFDLHPQKTDTSLGADITAENIIELLDRVRPDYVQYDCKGHAGYAGYPAKIGWPSPGIVKDSLAVWRKATEERGVQLFIHYSGVWDSKAVEGHPEWARVDARGGRDPNATSVFGPYVDELLIPQLKEVTAAYNLDGLWVDGECWAVEPDYSPAALKAWRTQTGYESAPKDKAESHWLEWKMFHRRAFESYLNHWVDALHAFKPELQITSNWMYTTFAPKPVAARLDFLSGDYSPSLSVDRARVEARYLANTGMPWDLMAWGFDHGKGQMWSLKSPVHLQQEAAVVLMQGGGFQVYNNPTRSGYIIPEIISQLAEVAAFCRERQALSHKSRSIPQVALVLSETSLWDKMDRVFSPWAGEFDELEGALHMLLELHYSVDILAEHQLISRLEEFPLVVIPDSPKLGPEFLEALASYVKKGGSLLLLGEKCARLFEPLLGVTLKGVPKEASVELATPAGPVSVSGRWQEASAVTARPMGFHYPTRDLRRGGSPAATISGYGEGRVGSVFGPVALAFLQGHHPGIRQFVGALCAELFPRPAALVDGPPTLDVALRRTADGRLSLHLLNRSNFPVPDRYNFIDFVPEVGPLEVSLALDARPREVVWMPGRSPLKWTYGNGRLQTTIPSLELHGMLVVE